MYIYYNKYILYKNIWRNTPKCSIRANFIKYIQSSVIKSKICDLRHFARVSPYTESISHWAGVGSERNKGQKILHL